MKAREETQKHIEKVRDFIDQICGCIYGRGLLHDQSKLENPEVEIFDKYTEKLRNTTYNSEEYRKHLEEMKPALDHHYSHNRHHPEFHNEGILGMTLIDLIEMLADWKAATERHDDGDIMKSLKVNEKRFDIPPELVKILENTILALRWERNKD